MSRRPAQHRPLARPQGSGRRTNPRPDAQGSPFFQARLVREAGSRALPPRARVRDGRKNRRLSGVDETFPSLGSRAEEVATRSRKVGAKGLAPKARRGNHRRFLIF